MNAQCNISRESKPYQFFGCAIAGMILAVWKTREAKEAAAQPA